MSHLGATLIDDSNELQWNSHHGLEGENTAISLQTKLNNLRTLSEQLRSQSSSKQSLLWYNYSEKAVQP